MTDPEIFAALKKKFPGVKEGTLRARRCELIGKGTARFDRINEMANK
jgi:hypothetical protein